MLPMKDKFYLPEGVIYLDGNSLGPLPKAVPGRMSSVLSDEWGAHLIKGWNVDDWMGQPLLVANRVGRLIGAPEGSTVLGDTLSIKVYQALSAALVEAGGHQHVPRDDFNYAVEVGLRMLTRRRIVGAEAGRYRVTPGEEGVLAFYANSIAHLPGHKSD